MKLKLTSKTGIVKKIVTQDANPQALLARLNGNSRWIDAGEDGKLLIDIEAFIEIEILPEPIPEPEPE